MLAVCFSITTLCVVLIMGIVVAIVTPKIGSLSVEAKNASTSRHAMTLASISKAAKQAGAVVVKPGDTLEEVIRKVCEGIKVEDPASAAKGRVFTCGSLSEEDIAEVAKYLRLDNGVLEYTSIPSK